MSEANAIGKAVVSYMNLSSKELAKPQETPKGAPPEAQKEGNWWDSAMNRIKAEGIIENEHDGNDTVTWAEFATVISRLLDKINK
jgi:N-acetylmuramoyl-L-alanine amidase